MAAAQELHGLPLEFSLPALVLAEHGFRRRTEGSMIKEDHIWIEQEVFPKGRHAAIIWHKPGPLCLTPELRRNMCEPGSERMQPHASESSEETHGFEAPHTIAPPLLLGLPFIAHVRMRRHGR
jgi:hypothetical protein